MKKIRTRSSRRTTQKAEGQKTLCGSRRAMSALLALLLALFPITATVPAFAAESTRSVITGVPERLEMSLAARYDVDPADAEGGLEIVTYNTANRTAYAVDGVNRLLLAIPLSSMTAGGSSGTVTATADLSAAGIRIDLAAAAEAAVNGFQYGDITCVAVSPDQTKIAVTLQAEGYNDPGLVAVYPVDQSADTLGTPVFIRVGVQPDMVVFADNSTVLTANEGEPRMGYGTNSSGTVVADPKGSISIVHLADGTAQTAGFDAFDAQRAALVAKGVLMAKGQAPSVDLEPEYIAVRADGKTAYVALQENNAVAVLDIASASFTGVFALGFKDHGKAGNELYLTGTPKLQEGLLGAYMPDGITLLERAGKTYVLTANEGDGREWSSTEYPESHEDAGDPNGDDTSYYVNETKVTLHEGKEDAVAKVVVIDPAVTDGLPADKQVLFGARSFTVFEVTPTGLVAVYDSGSDFERITAKAFPDSFNTSNDKNKKNDRSLKKGPEPENVTLGTVGDRTFAFVALERIGGILAYDITDLTDVRYANYLNTRDFAAEDAIGGDSGPEGIRFVQAKDSPTGQALLLSGNEITGTMPVYSLTMAPGNLEGALVILHTNDTHGGDVAVPGKSIGTAGVAQLVKDFEAAGAEVLLISAGDAIQGDPLVNLGMGRNAIDFMNLAGYDLMTPGNHEFDWGYKNLLTLEDAAEFPLLAANILDRASKEPVFEDNLILETEAGRIGLFGVITPETQTKANPENVSGLTFLAGEAMYAAAQAEVDELEAAGCETIVCVAHLGDDAGSAPNRSLDLAAKVDGIDILIDGHSHSVLDGDESDTTLIASAGTRFSHVGVLVLEDGETESYLIAASDYSRVDPTVNAVINAKAAEIDKALSTKFAATEVLLDGNRAPGVRTQETNLGDFAADAILWAANKAVGAGMVDAAITNGGGIRASIAVGDVTMKDMKTVFPFGNTISTVEVTGAQLLEMLEAATYSLPDAVGAFPQVAGLTFTVRMDIPYEKGTQYEDSTYFAPAKPGTRVRNVQVGGKALDLKKTYVIATNNFLAAGGDTYAPLKTVESYNTYVALEDALIQYTDAVLDGVISSVRYAQPAGRITMATANLPYTDVSMSSWYAGAVEHAHATGRMTGGTATLFKPSDMMTGNMVAVAMYNMAGTPDAGTGTDAQKALAWATENKLFADLGTAFSPTAAMSRQAMASVLYRYAVYAGDDMTAFQNGQPVFSDKAGIAGWAVKGAAYCQMAGIIQGRTGNRFAPEATATRAEGAVMLMRFATRVR